VGVCALKTWKLIFAVGLWAALLAGCNNNDSMVQSAGASVATSSATSVPTSNAATLSWEAPTTDTNGEPLTNLAGYRIYYGSNESSLTQLVTLNSVGTQTYVIDNLTPGTWFFAIRAVAENGVESAMSDVVSKTIG
jgi:predicted small secreted protein